MDLALGISVSLWINVSKMEQLSENGFYRSEFDQSFVDASYIWNIRKNSSEVWLMRLHLQTR